MRFPRLCSAALLAFALAASLLAAEKKSTAPAAPPGTAPAATPYPLILGPIRLWEGDAPGALGQRPSRRC